MQTTPRIQLAALCASLLLTACPSDPVCPPGTVLDTSGRCVDVDDVPDGGVPRPDAMIPDTPDGDTPDPDADTECEPTGEEICNGLDDDCDGLIDEDLSRTCGETSVGACTMGTETCEDGEWVGCDAVLPSEEICDPRGIDENCDGTVDEGCPCVSGETQTCGTDVGACRTGTQTCTDGTWGSCTGGVLPRAETCNGQDDDCDGMVDEDTSGASCGSNIGRCRQGTEVCEAGTLRCQGAIEPRPEMCNGMDDNCNGQIDDGLMAGCWQDNDGDGYAPASALAMGICLPATGMCPPMFTARQPNTRANQDCDDTDASVNPGATEVCDGRDNNCSGTVDDLPPGCWVDNDGDSYPPNGAAATCRPAAGCPVGYTTRAPSMATWDCNDNDPAINPGAAEVCDGRDNNCSGNRDDAPSFQCVLATPVSCTTTCGTTGSATCNAMCAVPTGNACTPPAETCNGVDDDCDGHIDEGVTSWRARATTGLTGSRGRLISFGDRHVYITTGSSRLQARVLGPDVTAAVSSSVLTIPDSTTNDSFDAKRYDSSSFIVAWGARTGTTYTVYVQRFSLSGSSITAGPRATVAAHSGTSATASATHGFQGISVAVAASSIYVAYPSSLGVETPLSVRRYTTSATSLSAQANTATGYTYARAVSSDAIGTTPVFAYRRADRTVCKFTLSGTTVQNHECGLPETESVELVSGGDMAILLTGGNSSLSGSFVHSDGRFRRNPTIGGTTGAITRQGLGLVAYEGPLVPRFAASRTSTGWDIVRAHGGSLLALHVTVPSALTIRLSSEQRFDAAVGTTVSAGRASTGPLIVLSGTNPTTAHQIRTLGCL
ncbi:MAG: putative metal-binding motif-containing protein [Myxococcales bacterium]|nr:putative metal-binding motif-containing protein [Myxococcales bacterium]